MTAITKKTRSSRDHIRPGPGDVAFNIVNYTVFILITLACIFPFYYLFINTISSNELVRLGKIQLYPREIHFQNYVQVMKIPGILDALFVSIGRTVLGTIWTVGGCAFLGYLFTKREMWLRKITGSAILVCPFAECYDRIPPRRETGSGEGVPLLPRPITATRANRGKCNEETSDCNGNCGKSSDDALPHRLQKEHTRGSRCSILQGDCQR